MPKKVNKLENLIKSTIFNKNINHEIHSAMVIGHNLTLLGFWIRWIVDKPLYKLFFWVQIENTEQWKNNQRTILYNKSNNSKRTFSKFQTSHKKPKKGKTIS